MAITKEQIFAIADELDNAGQKTTLAVVRKHLGGGSFTTIHEAMAEWRARKARKANPLRESAPAEITDRLTELGVDVWAAAMNMANNRLAADREALEVARKEAEATHQEAVELADQLTLELEAVKAKVVRLESAAAAMSDQLAAASQQAAVEEAKVGELRKELDRARTDVQAERDKANKAREEAAALQGRLDVLESGAGRKPGRKM